MRFCCESVSDGFLAFDFLAFLLALWFKLGEGKGHKEAALRFLKEVGEWRDTPARFF